MQIKSSRPINIGIILIFVIITMGICSANDVNLELVSRYDGLIGVVEVAGDYAYLGLGQGEGLVVLDISNISTPSEVGRITTSSDVYGVAVSGNYAYAACSESGLIIMDISDPSSPILMGNYDTDYAHSIAVSGNYAYVADGNTGLVVLDISDPSTPTFTGSYSSGGDALAVAVSDKYAYIADSWNGLLIVDISDPSASTLAGRYDTADPAMDVAVSGNHAYVADAGTGLAIFDVSDPSSPILEGSYDTVGDAVNVAVSGNYSYVADAENGLIAIDISDPSAPTLAGSYDADYSIYVTVSGNHVYLANTWNGLDILKMTTSTGTDIVELSEEEESGTTAPVSPVSGASVVIGIKDIQGSPGSTVQVPIYIEGATDVGSVDLMLKYDPSVLKVLSVETAGLSKNAILESNITNPGQIKIALADASGINGAGEIVIISFSIIGDADTLSPLSFGEVSVYNLEVVEQQIMTQNGKFTAAAESSKGMGYKSFLLMSLIGVILAAMIVRRR